MENRKDIFRKIYLRHCLKNGKMFSGERFFRRSGWIYICPFSRLHNNPPMQFYVPAQGACCIIRDIYLTGRQLRPYARNCSSCQDGAPSLFKSSGFGSGHPKTERCSPVGRTSPSFRMSALNDWKASHNAACLKGCFMRFSPASAGRKARRPPFHRRLHPA